MISALVLLGAFGGFGLGLWIGAIGRRAASWQEGYDDGFAAGRNHERQVWRLAADRTRRHEPVTMSRTQTETVAFDGAAK